MKRIARWSTIFLLLCSIIWAGTASAAMIVNNNMSALNTLNTQQQPDTTGQGLSADAAGARNRRWHVGQYGLG